MSKTGYFGRHFGDRYFAPRYYAPPNFRSYSYFGTYFADSYYGPRYYPSHNPGGLSAPVVRPFIPNLYNAIPQWYKFHLLVNTSYGSSSLLLDAVVIPPVQPPSGPFGLSPGRPIRFKVPRSLLLRDDEEIVTFLAALLQSRILH